MMFYLHNWPALKSTGGCIESVKMHYQMPGLWLKYMKLYFGWRSAQHRLWSYIALC